jgi:small-conductance mechanosensitive channel
VRDQQVRQEVASQVADRSIGINVVVMTGRDVQRVSRLILAMAFHHRGIINVYNAKVFLEFREIVRICFDVHIYTQ